MFEANKKYQVKAIDAGLGETKSGAAQPWVQFQAENGDTMKWYGNLTGSTKEKEEKSIEITAEALAAAGFQGNETEDLKKPFALMFPTTPVVTIKVSEQEYLGKKSLKITGVYSANSEPKKFMGQAPKMGSALAKARKKFGVKQAEESPF